MIGKTNAGGGNKKLFSYVEKAPKSKNAWTSTLFKSDKENNDVIICYSGETHSGNSHITISLYGFKENGSKEPLIDNKFHHMYFSNSWKGNGYVSYQIVKSRNGGSNPQPTDLDCYFACVK